MNMIQTYSPNQPWIKKEDASNVVALLVLFIIWPFAAWIYSLFRANQKSSYMIFFLFSLLLCWHMAPAGLSDGYHDFLGIMERFTQTNFSTSEILHEIEAFFTFSDEAPKELYENLLTWLTKTIFGNNYHFYYLLASIPVALCQLRCMRRITSDTRFRTGTFLGIVVIVLFILPRDIISVQNPRFTTGVWWNVMACIFYFCDQKHKLWYIALILLSPFFHAGMWIFVIIFFSYIFIPFKNKYLETFAIVSMPFALFSADLVLDVGGNISILPDYIRIWVEGYLTDEAYNRFIYDTGRSGFWWVTSFFNIGQKVVYCYMVLLLIKNKKTFENNVEASRFFPFFLYFFACVNMIQSLPEVSTRYYGILKIFEMFMWFKAFHLTQKKVILVLLAFSSWHLLNRYGYVLGGALSVNTPLDIFVTPLPYLMGKGLFW